MFYSGKGTLSLTALDAIISPVARPSFLTISPMIFTPLIYKALNTAARLHQDQQRKALDQPYIVHPVGVAMILSRYTDDQNIIAAALLHDVLEDVPSYNENDMLRDFGPDIVRTVKEVSEKKDPRHPDNTPGNWKQRKEGYLANLQHDSEAALLVCAADKIHNLISLRESYQILGVKAFSFFHTTTGDKLWFYRSVLEILKNHLQNPIVDELSQLLATVELEVEALEK